MSGKPTVLIVDDSDGASALQQNLNGMGSVEAKVLHPNDVELDDIRRSDLVLVDFHLDEWPQRDELDQLALKTPDGLALSSIFRRYARQSERDSPTAIAILTGKMDELASPLPHENREHALAHMNSLEWVFQKAKPDEESQLSLQIVDLALAVTHLPAQWSGNGARPLHQLASCWRLTQRILRTNDYLRTSKHAHRRFTSCLTGAMVLAVLRWMLHRILPYPCFLWNTHYLAARLAVDYGALVVALGANRSLEKFLEPAKYNGALSNFLGPRWWRSRVENLLWEITEGQSSDPAVVRQRVNALIKSDLPASKPMIHPVVCVNSNYEALDQFYSINESVRIRPDDWPPYADQGWTTIELAKSEPKLRSLVIVEDVSRLKE